MSLLDSLNPEQLAAVTLPRESALILAGAGSGKTKVLTARIAWLIQTGQVGPNGVLAVTFTNKAAKEMLHRISSMLPINTRSMWVGTFHGLCNRMLRAHWKEAGLPQAFQILDMQDQLSAIKRMYKVLGIDAEKFPPKQLSYFIGSAKDQGLRPKDVEAHDEYHRMMVRLYEAYEAQCQREGVVDFAELLLRSFELLGANPALREHYQARFKYILVDEFQDTNSLQYNWLKRLAGSQGCIFAVGDDDQSIYAFRGARVANMVQFENDFNVQNRIKLEQNYRSVGNVLKAANVLIAHNKARLGKELWTEAGEGEAIRVYEATSDQDEAAFIIDRIKKLVLEEGYGRSDIAILYRSNAQSRVVEQALFNAGMPYRVYGGLRFFERAEIKHALAYLRLMDNADDDNSFSRVVNFPARGIGARSVEQLQDISTAQGTSLYRAIHRMEGRAQAGLKKFADLIERMRFETRGLSLADLVDKVINESGLVAHFQADKDGEDRVENLKELVNAAASFAIAEGYYQDAAATMVDEEKLITPLADFLSHASLEAGDNAAAAGQEAIQLMTAHSAKGLEFKCVFVTGLEEGLFPHENSIGNSVEGGDGTSVEAVEEERRLMYVAITRAREQLFLSHAQQRMLHGQIRYHLRSRFLDELPEEVLKWLTPKRAHIASQGWDALDSKVWGQNKTLNVGYSNKAAKRPYDIGTGVNHAKFGSGVVVAYEGEGDDQRIQINFGRQGMKWLMLSLAKLERG
ncbi:MULTISPECIES: UvrD-helicase domain-containing protein [unclassified Limnobacter]|uniref:UvrD-helicase domain-containing protein n=1 Tax=unclassified Limnobacter TaxID=2630203 RepID=UPI000C5692B5|nr:MULTISPECIES: UvrD-helicase domain-containing protein [unclassified Limnobacter]MBT83714.1 DNA helicase II [Sutterellaceae bacterium]